MPERGAGSTKKREINFLPIDGAGLLWARRTAGEWCMWFMCWWLEPFARSTPWWAIMAVWSSSIIVAAGSSSSFLFVPSSRARLIFFFFVGCLGLSLVFPHQLTGGWKKEDNLSVAVPPALEGASFLSDKREKRKTGSSFIVCYHGCLVSKLFFPLFYFSSLFRRRPAKSPA